MILHSKEDIDMMGQKKFNMKQHHNLCLDDFVKPGNLYRKIDETIDFNFIYDLAKSLYSYTGQSSLDPIVFFKIELVGLLEGIHEDRSLERRLNDSFAIRWFLGYDLDEDLPVHSTISRTRKDRISLELYQAVFDHILNLCHRHQLIKGAHQSIDSTLLKANASLHSLEDLRPKVLEHYKKTTASNASQAQEENPQRKPPSPDQPLRRDSEAKATKKPGFPSALYYKASASVDSKHGILTQAQVDDANQNDVKLLKPIVQNTRQQLEALQLSLKAVSLDLGYYSGENIHFLDQERITAYLPPKQEENHQGLLTKDQFRYEPNKDQFLCPKDKILTFRSHAKQPHIKRYQAQPKDCASCPQKSLCTTGKARTLQRSIYEPIIEQTRLRYETPEGKEAMKLRRTQAEGLYARLKEQLKFRKCYALGIENAKKKFLVACSVLNLKKLLSALSPLASQTALVFHRFVDFFKEQLALSQNLLLSTP
jgi:transposase